MLVLFSNTVHIFLLFFQSWIKVLQPSFEERDEEEGHVNKKKVNTCPFTGQKLSRRDLVKLDASNLEEYREKIINGPK